MNKNCIAKLLDHLERFPFGVYKGRVITCRGTTEGDIAQWITEFYRLREEVQETLS